MTIKDILKENQPDVYDELQPDKMTLFFEMLEELMDPIAEGLREISCLN